MSIIEFQKLHFMLTDRAFQRIIAKRKKNRCAPLMETLVNTMFFFGNGSAKFFINIPVSRINTAVADHFEMFFRDMADEPFDKINGRNCFLNILFIFMAIIMKSNLSAIVMIDSGSSDNRASKISANVFNDSFLVALIRFSINIKAMFMFRVAKGFNSFKRGVKFLLK